MSTRDPDVSAATVKEMFGNPIRFESDPARDFAFAVDGVVLDSGLTVATMLFPTAAALDSGELPDYTVSVMEGDIRWHGKDTVKRITAPFIVPPGTGTRLRWTSTRTLNVGFPADRLAPYTGGPNPSMAALNSENADTRVVEAVVRMLNATLLSAPDVLDDPLIHANALETLIAAIAATYPIVREATEHALSTALRRAIAYIDEHLAQPITVAAVAEAARMSVRGIQALFQRELGISPLQYVRRERLAAARAELLVATEPGVVALIARRWGFAHPSRFAADYFAAFGEHPGSTLREQPKAARDAMTADSGGGD
ncbi:helix-turn-helix domain-containing protein [Microbacterium mangrovi]|uniref:helix-turn-helix domain-containing protein n=1 Tax=Microbacterium mangrovi TaxID=1348253 RepID=UPI0012DFFCD9|nr:AraC family transcriptional regulator [Microbacterium mangrovi]